MIRDLAVDTRRRTTASASLALLLIGALVAGLVVLASPVPPALAQTAPATGVYVPLSPARIFNTQAGGGGVVGAQTSRDVQVAGLGGIPTTDVLAVVLDLTVYNNNSGAWGILWQAGTTRPYPASSINYVPGRVVTNSVTTKVGAAGSAAGKVSFFTWEATDMLIDVVGYYRTAPAGGGGYVPLTQTRILDTAGAKIPANSSIDRKLRGVAGIPDSTAVTAVVFNATVYGAAGPGPLTVWPRGVARPDTSVMNYSPATARTAMVTATLSADGWVSVWTWASTDLIIDIAGYYTTGSNSTFVPLTPKRIVDTRYNGTRYNNVPNWGIGPITQYLAPNTTTALKVTGTGGVPETGVSTVILNVVADASTTSTSSQISFLTVWASGDAQPGTATMLYYGAESASNLVMAKVGADGKINIYNYYASTELIVDVVGYFTTGTGPGAPTNVIATPASQAATLAWGPPVSDGGTAIAGYLVKVYKTTPTLTYVSETTTCATCTSTTLTGLTNGQPYQFEVFARNSLGYGSSATSNVVTPNMTTTTSSSTSTSSSTTSSSTTSTSTTTTSISMPRPTQISSVSATATSSRTITVNWTPSPDTEQVTSYRITVSPACSGCTNLTASGTTNSSIVSGLRPGTEYAFRVIATNAGGDSDPSLITGGSRATTYAEPPGAPTGVTATARHGAVAVSWQRPMELNGSVILSYDVIVSPECSSCGGRYVEAPSTETIVTGLADGQEYSFNVRANSNTGPVTSTDLATATPVPILRVMTWNIVRGLTSPEPWGTFNDGNPSLFADEIAAQNADVVVLQEVTKVQSRRIAEYLGWAWDESQWVQTKDPQSRWPDPLEVFCVEQVWLKCRQQGIAIISRFPLSNINGWLLPVAPNEAGQEERSFQRAVVTIEHGFQVNVYNTHLASGDTNDVAREQQVEAIRSQMAADRLGQPGFRAVLAGDLNAAWPDEKPIPLLLQTMRDAWTAVYPPPNGPPGNTSTPENPQSRIDYVMTEKTSELPIEAARVGTTVGLSDHHWVWADI